LWRGREEGLGSRGEPLGRTSAAGPARSSRRKVLEPRKRIKCSKLSEGTHTEASGRHTLSGIGGIGLTIIERI